ncbi:UbiA prenyltransferase [Actinobacteria bacterium OV320]|nr:UbiA prenyltransferase [Actinobacteria bacterium OV320]
MSGGDAVRGVQRRADASATVPDGEMSAEAGASGRCVAPETGMSDRRVGSEAGVSDGWATPETGVLEGKAGSEADTSDGKVASGSGTSDGWAAAEAGTPGGPVGAVTGASERSRARVRAWAELLRLPALFTVPGDALAGAAALTRRPDHRTLLAIGSSCCLYEAGMVLNDWADRAEDAADRPHRPLPSGRVSPAAAFTAACALTAAGLALAARAGRPALTIAAPLAATVWSYDLALKHTPAGPFAMAVARGLDLLLGAAATGGRARPALPSAALLATHTLAVTALSRQETREGTPTAALAALATTGALTWLVQRRPALGPSPDRRSPDGQVHGRRGRPEPGSAHRSPAPLTAALAATYAGTTARSYLHASLNPSPPLTQQAVGAGIRGTIPLQAALLARSGGTAATATALLTAALAPVARRLARRVSIT